MPLLRTPRVALRTLFSAPVIPALSASFALGIILARFTSLSLAAAAALCLSALAAALASQLKPRPALLFLPLIAASALFAGAFLYRVETAVSPSPRLTRVLREAEAEKQTLFFDAIVESSPRLDDRKARFLVRVTAAGPSPREMAKVSGLAQASAATDTLLPRYPDRIHFEARAHTTDFLDPSSREYFNTMGVAGFLSIPDFVPVRVTGRARKFFLFTWGKALGERLRATIIRTLPSPASLVLGQMMFGKIVSVPPEIEDKFRYAGVIHVLVVSGMHVWMMLSCFLLLSFLWRRNPYVSAAVLGVVLLLFYSMCGGGPSVVRAVVMGFVFLGALLIKRDYDRVAAFFLAGLFLLVFNPGSLFLPGLQLSFLACAGLIFIYPRLRSALPRPLKSRFLTPVFLSLCAQLPIYPVIAHHFNSASIIAPVSNIFVVPLSGVLIPLGFAYSIVVSLVPPAAVALAPPVAFLTNALLWIVDVFSESNLPFGAIPVARPGFWVILIYFGAIFCWTMFLHSMKRGRDETITSWMLAGGAGVCVLLWAWLFVPPSNLLKVTFIDVGEGDSILIDAPYELNSYRRFHMLIDGGESSFDSAYSFGRERVARTLAQSGIHHLDAVLLTHPDLDHMGALEWVLDTIPVDRWMDSGAFERKTRKNTANIARFKSRRSSDSRKNDLLSCERFLKKVKISKINRIIARNNLYWTLNSGISFHILHPAPEDIALGNLSENELSSVLKMSYKNASFLFPGDIEKYGEFSLSTRSYDELPSTVLKVPHHGSFTSSSMRFLGKVRPVISVFSVGRKNLYGHPHKSVLWKYNRIGSAILRTDIHGDITAKTDGTRLFLKTETNHAPLRVELDPKK